MKNLIFMIVFLDIIDLGYNIEFNETEIYHLMVNIIIIYQRLKQMD